MIILLIFAVQKNVHTFVEHINCYKHFIHKLINNPHY